MKCCGKEMIKEEDKWVCKTCGYELIPLFKKEEKEEKNVNNQNRNKK